MSVNPIPIPPLPTWTDAASVAAYLTSVIAMVVGFIALFHPGFTEPTVVQALVTPVSVAVAAIVQAINIITHRSLQKAAIAAGYRVRA